MRHKRIVKITIWIFFFFICAVSYAQDPKQSGTDLGNTAKDKYGNKSGLKTGLVNPLISSDTLLSTLDGSKTFNAQLVCPSSKSFLQVFTQPSASGDITTILINEDTNMDGTTDYAFQVPFPVSGVCANGVISCNAGTWSGCRYYKWISDSSYKVSLLQLGNMDRLGGCYCINNSCGSNLFWNNLSTVLKDLGGGVAGAVVAANPKFAISDVKVDSTTITYYGQSAKECSQAGTPAESGTSDPQQHYSNSFQIQGAVQTQVVSQSADPNSYYSLLKNSLAMQKQMAEVNTCKEDRVAACIPDSTSYTSNINNLCTSLENNPKCRIRDEVVDGVTTYQNYNPTMLIPQPVCRSLTCQREATCNNNLVYTSGFLGLSSCSAQGLTSSTVQGAWDCATQPGVSCDLAAQTCRVNGVAGLFTCTQTDPKVVFNPPCIAGTCSGNLQAPCLPNSQPSYLNCTNSTTDLNGNLICHQAECIASPPTATYTAYVPQGNTVAPSAVLDITSARGQCYGLYYLGIYDSSGKLVAYTNSSGNAGCGSFTFPLVYQAPVAGNYTVKFWMSAHGYYGSESCAGNVNQILCPLDPSLPCAGSVSGSSICAQVVTHNICDWWHKERTYLCDTGEKFDFSDAQKRLQVITTTAKDNTSSFYYSDYRKDNSGNWITESFNTALAARDTYGDCELICKVKITGTDTQAGTTGTTAQYRQGTQYGTFYYKTCNNGVCPAGPGEQIVKDCQCINEFAEAASIVQTMRMAGKDFICSSGASKPLQ